MNRATTIAHRLLTFMTMLVMLLAIGCQPGTIGEADGVDARPPAPDTGVQTPPDAAAYDAPAAPPDAAPLPPDAAPLPPTCDELYSTALEYILCVETPTTCLFNVRINGTNCNELCAQFDSECVAAFDNETGAECIAILDSGDDCTTTRNTEICECKRF